MPNKYIKGIFGLGKSKAAAKPAVNIQRDFYTMATVDGDTAEITMYGVIVEERPRDWWTDEPIEGNFIVLNEFLEDLKEIADVKYLTLRLNSVGGDAFASITIHNRLRELKAKVTAIVDGVAMSGGSLIMCAADVVRVNPSSLIMIHKCWMYIWGGFTGDDLRGLANEAEAVDKAQAAIYKRKTGLEEDAILSMMADVTYMTGSEAVDKGFADELIEGEKPSIAASADKRTLYVNGRALPIMSPLSKLPDTIPTVDSAKAVETNIKQPAQTGGKEGGTIMAKNLEELKKEDPALAEQFMAEAKAAVSAEAIAEAIKAERQRIADIDEISALYDDETVREAKYGEKACTAQEMAFRAAQKAAKQGQKHIKDHQDDVKASGAMGVTATPNAGDDDPEKKVLADVDVGVEAAKKARQQGGK